MPNRMTPLHICHLVTQLRLSAVEGQQCVAGYDDDGWQLSLASGLMADAADALEAMLAERLANDDKATLVHETRQDSQTPEAYPSSAAESC